MPPLLRKIEPGDVIGRCRAIRELGRGGVGTVFLATHQTLQIEVALKILSPSLSLENPALAERFIREAQLAARIRHPNVIAVMDAAQDETTGLYFIVMEYVGGGSLSWHLRNGPLPEAQSMAIVTGIAQALVTAEENRIVHRDIKPDNIMLDLRGTSKLADLGLAKHSLDSHVSLTIGGTFMGTPAYMSPDQARDAKAADTRDDIYSLGASFYECLTGQPPFQGETPYNIMSELLTKPSPRPRATRPELSLSADLICRKMMAKTRDLRYATARALVTDLHHAQTYGDAGLDRLEAASFERDAKEARDEASRYGVEIRADAALPPHLPAGVRRRDHRAPASRGSDYGVFAVAGMLVILVTITAAILVWVGPERPVAFLMGRLGMSPPVQPGPAVAVPAKVAPHHHAAKPDSTTGAGTAPPRALPVEIVPKDAVPLVPSNEPASVTPTVPVALPVDPGDLTNPPVATPVIPDATGGAIPATAAAPATPDSAFVARTVAENSLHATNLPTGHAELLRIVGKRDPTTLTPSAWTFYFYDRNAAGNARLVTVSGGKVIKSGEDLVDFAAPYDERLVLPEDKLLFDSSQALQIAIGLVPGLTVTSSEFILLQQRNSVPMWKITLWSRGPDGESRRLGDVTILGENGVPISRDLKP